MNDAAISSQTGHAVPINTNATLLAGKVPRSRGILAPAPGPQLLRGARSTALRTLSASHKRPAPLCVSFVEVALNELVAQLVEQRPFKAWVVRSSRTELTMLESLLIK